MNAAQITTGIETCASAGTAVRFTTTDAPVRSIIITANSTNTNIVVIGDLNVVAAAATRRGHPLAANESLSIDAPDHGKAEAGRINLKDLYIDAEVGGEMVSWIAFQ